MLTSRVARLSALIDAAGRPGGMYPVFSLATRPVSDEERAAMHALIARSPLAQAFDDWRDPARSPLERAISIAAVEPAFAHVHFLVADLWLRDDDAHAEPHPELRTRIRALRPKLASAYARVLGALQDDFDSTAERCAARRGFNFSLNEVAPLLGSPEELDCFGRGGMTWCGGTHGCPHGALTSAEVAEHALNHTPEGISASLDARQLASLACADLLTALHVHGNVAVALRSLVRSPRLSRLTLACGPVTDGAAISALPLTSLSMTLPRDDPFPSWLSAIPTLRSLTLDHSAPRTGVDFPATIPELPGLESLTLHRVHRLPENLGALPGLRKLEIEGRHFAGLPRSLVELGALTSLHVGPVHALEALPEGFERMHALREVFLDRVASPEPPPALLRMPWLTRVALTSSRRWSDAQLEALRRALPETNLQIWYTGDAR